MKVDSFDIVFIFIFVALLVGALLISSSYENMLRKTHYQIYIETCQEKFDLVETNCIWLYENARLR